LERSWQGEQSLQLLANKYAEIAKRTMAFGPMPKRLFFMTIKLRV
jgi:hypothetical protein